MLFENSAQRVYYGSKDTILDLSVHNVIYVPKK